MPTRYRRKRRPTDAARIADRYASRPPYGRRRLSHGSYIESREPRYSADIGLAAADGGDDGARRREEVVALEMSPFGLDEPSPRRSRRLMDS